MLNKDCLILNYLIILLMIFQDCLILNDLIILLVISQDCRQPRHGHDEEAGERDEDNAEWRKVILSFLTIKTPETHLLDI